MGRRSIRILKFTFSRAAYRRKSDRRPDELAFAPLVLPINAQISGCGALAERKTNIASEVQTYTGTLNWVLLMLALRRLASCRRNRTARAVSCALQPPVLYLVWVGFQ